MPFVIYPYVIYHCHHSHYRRWYDLIEGVGATMMVTMMETIRDENCVAAGPPRRYSS